MRRVMMLPGWMHGAEFWRPLHDTVASGFNAIALDWQIALEVDQLAARLRDSPVPVYLLGWSLGALSALRLALAQPESVAGLLLVGATARLPADPPGYAGASMRRLRAMRAAIKQDAKACYSAFFELCGITPEQRPSLVSSALHLPESCAAKGLDALMQWDLRLQLGQIQTPVTLFHGGADQVVPVSQAEHLAGSLPDAELHVLAGEPHTPGPAMWDAVRKALVREAGR